MGASIDNLRGGRIAGGQRCRRELALEIGAVCGGLRTDGLRHGDGKLMPSAAGLAFSFAAAVRERGHSTPWCITAYRAGPVDPITNTAKMFFSHEIGPAQAAPGGIVCAPVRF